MKTALGLRRKITNRLNGPGSERLRQDERIRLGTRLNLVNRHIATLVQAERYIVTKAAGTIDEGEALYYDCFGIGKGDVSNEARDDHGRWTTGGQPTPEAREKPTVVISGGSAAKTAKYIGMSPDKYAEEVQKIMRKGGINGTVQCHFMWHNKEQLIWHVRANDHTGKEAVSISRYMDIFGNEKVVEHSSFNIIAEYRGRGVAKNFLAFSMANYEKVGIDTVSVTAVGHGSYVWAKFGFVPEPGQWNYVKRTLGVKGNRDETILDSDEPRDIWKVADSEKGFQRLYGIGWTGHLSLHDKPAMERFRKYVLVPKTIMPKIEKYNQNHGNNGRFVAGAGSYTNARAAAHNATDVALAHGTAESHRRAADAHRRAGDLVNGADAEHHRQYRSAHTKAAVQLEAGMHPGRFHIAKDMPDVGDVHVPNAGGGDGKRRKKPKAILFAQGQIDNSGEPND